MFFNAQTMAISVRPLAFATRWPHVPVAFEACVMTNPTTAALIMAGGRSERMRAGGSAQHKGLRTVRGMPLIERNIRTLSWFGFKQIFVAINRQEEALSAWVNGPGKALAPLELLVEDQPLGTIGATALLPRELEDVVIINVDNLTSLDLKAFARFHAEQKAAATIATHEQAFPMPFGMLELSGQRVVAYREKPKLPVTISSGLYMLNRRAIDRVRSGARLDVPALIDGLLQDGEIVAAYPHSERWIDINDEAALANAEQLWNGSQWPGER
jgi:NDP-sugar pyrophosphorylase family protein